MTSDSGGGTPSEQGGESRVLLRQGALYSLSSAAPLLVTLLITPLLTRTIDGGQFGVVGIGLVIIQVGLVALGLGLQEPIARHGIMGRSGISGAKAIVLQALVPSGVLALLACTTAFMWIPAVFRIPFDVGYVYALLAAWFFSMIAEMQGVLRAQDRPGPLVVVGLVASLVAPLAGIILVRVGPPTGSRYLAGIAIGYGIALVIAGADFLLGERPQRMPGDFLVALKLGLAMIFHQVAVYVATALCVIMTSRLLGVESAGRMQLTLYVATAPAIIAIAISNSWSALIYRTPSDRRTNVASHLTGDVARVVAILCGGLVMMLPIILPLLMPASYRPLELVAGASVACLGAIFFVAYLASVHILMAEGHSLSLIAIVPFSLALAALVVSLLPASTATLALIFPVATLGMAVGVRLVLPRFSAVSWRLTSVVRPTLFVLVISLAGIFMGDSGWWLAFRVVVAVGIGLLGLRYLKSVLGGGTRAHADA